MVRFAQKPSVRLFVGLTVLFTGLDDVVEEISGTEGWINVSVYHGITLLGVQQVMSSLGTLLDGVNSTSVHAAKLLAKKTAAEASARASDSQSTQSE